MLAGFDSHAQIDPKHRNLLELGCDQTLLTGWIPLTCALNSNNRGMGLADLHPFVPSRQHKKRAVEISREIQHRISSYLFTVSLINFGLGCAVGLCFWFLGMPNPAMWGDGAGWGYSLAGARTVSVRRAAAGRQPDLIFQGSRVATRCEPGRLALRPCQTMPLPVAALLNFLPFFGATMGMVVVGLAGFWRLMPSAGHYCQWVPVCSCICWKVISSLLSRWDRTSF